MHSRSPSRTNPRAPRGALEFTPTTTSVKVAPTLRRRRSAALLRPRGCMRLVVRFGVGHGSWSCTDRARRRDRHFGPLRGGVQKFCPHFWTFEESRGGTRPACYRRANRASDAQGAASRVPAHPRSRTRRAGPFHVTWFTWGGCPLARRVLRLRRSIRASELGPGLLPGTGEHPRHAQQAWSLRRVNVSPTDFRAIVGLYCGN